MVVSSQDRRLMKHESSKMKASSYDRKLIKHVVDVNKAIVCQVGSLGDAYETWVHQPIVSKDSPRMFDNKVGEILTLTPWWLVPLLWLPLVAWNQLLSIRRSLSPIYSIICLFIGLFAWTLLEYLFHRYIFHFKTSSYWGNTLHYAIHGYHHKYPMDKYRLVLPPIWVATQYVPFWYLVGVLFPYKLAPALFSGSLLGYILYDSFHYYLHHGKPFNATTQKLKRYHMSHHFKSDIDSFGVTSMFWDRIFGTLPSTHTKGFKKS